MKLIRLFIVAMWLMLMATQAPSTGDGWCEDGTTCALVFGEE